MVKMREGIKIDEDQWDDVREGLDVIQALLALIAHKHGAFTLTDNQIIGAEKVVEGKYLRYLDEWPVWPAEV